MMSIAPQKAFLPEGGTYIVGRIVTAVGFLGIWGLALLTDSWLVWLMILMFLMLVVGSLALLLTLRGWRQNSWRAALLDPGLAHEVDAWRGNDVLDSWAEMMMRRAANKGGRELAPRHPLRTDSEKA